nr:hypothetical protein [Candidatus Saccharibacteria bacterium]
GKSSALYGLRQILFDQGTSYIAINGHYLDRPKRIANIIRWASRSGSTVLYDSFDYNFKRPSKTNKSKHNREQVLPSLREHLSGGNKLVVTSHGQDWFDRMSNSSLTEEFVSFIDELEATSLELFDKH